MAIWEDLLQIRPIGVTDDFFDLGGHSLLAVRLAARIEEQFGRSLALSDLLMGSTIESSPHGFDEPVGLAGRLATGRSRRLGARPAALSSCIRSAAASSATTPWPAAFDGARAVLGLQAAGLEGEAAPETDLVRMASRYVEALRAERPQGLTFWADGRWGASWRSRWPGSSPPPGTTYRSSFLIDCSVPVPRNAPQLVRRP